MTYYNFVNVIANAVRCKLDLIGVKLSSAMRQTNVLEFFWANPIADLIRFRAASACMTSCYRRPRNATIMLDGGNLSWLQLCLHHRKHLYLANWKHDRTTRFFSIMFTTHSYTLTSTNYSKLLSPEPQNIDFPMLISQLTSEQISNFQCLC